MYACAGRGSGLISTFKVSKGITSTVSRTVFPVQNEIDQIFQTNFPMVQAKLPKAQSLADALPKGGFMSPRVSTSFKGASQFRYAHTDIVQTPDFDSFRKGSAQSAVKYEKDEEDAGLLARKNFTYIMAAGVLFPGGVFVKEVVRNALSTFQMTQDVLAMSKTEIELEKIPEGKTVVMTWRSKPLFVRHRTQEEIELEAAVNASELRDPQHDHERTKKPEWLIVIGVCTHLGCVPVANAGVYGGFFCPCHGSHYDTSGRIRKGPAPLNLEVPPYDFPSDELCVVG